jgi:hypothetical protein
MSPWNWVKFALTPALNFPRNSWIVAAEATEATVAHESLTLKVYLTEKNFREFEIAGQASLYRLAEMINMFYGFSFDHAFGFYSDLDDYFESKESYELFADMGEPSVEGAKRVKTTKISEAFDTDGKAFLFLFDYGDEWMFKVERVSSVPSTTPKEFSRLMRSVGKSPKQYG